MTLKEVALNLASVACSIQISGFLEKGQGTEKDFEALEIATHERATNDC